MRILFVSHYALPHVGGIETSIAALADGLVRRGHEVTHLASSALRPGERRTDGERSYRVVRAPAGNLPERLGVPYPLFGPSLVRVARREVDRADVVHVHGFLYAGSAVALRAARRASMRPLRVLTEHVGHVPYALRPVDLIERAAIATLGRRCVRSAEAVAVYTERVAGELSELVPGTRILRIANGVDAERFRPPGPDERARLRRELGWDGRPRALFVGRKVAKKGLAVAVEAAALGGGRFELVVAGPGVRAPRGAASVTTLGAVAPDRIADLYRAADVFVLPSIGEGFPLSAQEAMASGLPVVLGDDPGYAPLVEGAGRGAVMAPPEGAAVAAAVDGLLADRETLAAAGAEAARHARERFSWETAVAAHEQLYAELAEARSGDRSR